MSMNRDTTLKCNYAIPRTRADYQQIGVAAELREFRGLLEPDRISLNQIVHSNEIPTLENRTLTLFSPYNKAARHHTFDQEVQNKLIEIANKYPIPDGTKGDFLTRISRIPLHNYFDDLLKDMETDKEAPTPSQRIFQSVFPKTTNFIHDPHFFEHAQEREALDLTLSESDLRTVEENIRNHEANIRALEDRCSRSVARGVDFNFKKGSSTNQNLHSPVMLFSNRGSKSSVSPSLSPPQYVSDDMVSESRRAKRLRNSFLATQSPEYYSSSGDASSSVSPPFQNHDILSAGSSPQIGSLPFGFGNLSSRRNAASTDNMSPGLLQPLGDMRFTSPPVNFSNARASAPAQLSAQRNSRHTGSFSLYQD